MRRLIENDKNIKISIGSISKNEITFLSSFKPMMSNGSLSYYDLCTHPLIKNHTKLRISINGNYFYGTSTRNRVSFSKRVLKKLKLEPLKTYQLVADFSNENLNNEHLFKKEYYTKSSDVVEGDRIILPKLLQDFEIKDFGKQIEVFYETRCKDSKKVRLNKEVEISEDLLRLFGMYQAEGTKTQANYLCFTNNDPNQIRYFKEKFTEIFGLEDNEWRLDISSSKDKEKIKSYWYNLLKIDNIYVLNSNRNSEYGTANLKINSNTIREIVQRILALIKNSVIQNNDYCGYFISGVLSGDGYVCIEGNRIKRIELYFNANKIEEEAMFYLNCLNRLDIGSHHIRIYYPKGNIILLEKANNIARDIKSVFENVKVIPKNNTRGIGGTIFIHKKMDIQKLANFKLFYPNISHYNKFYKYWHD